MKYTVLNDEPTLPLLERLLKIRNIDCAINDFFDPKISHYWVDPFLLSDIKKAIQRIEQAIEKKERIMIFWDYDVDGVTSSYMLYHFFQHFLEYKNISIMYPHRRHDGYGIKNKHIDEMKQKEISLIITVDNGITSTKEALYASDLWIDMIITDHHEKINDIPVAVAVVNPHVSDDYNFNGLCGASVVFKLINAISTHLQWDKQKKSLVFQYYLPLVAFATVADCVPLTHENRAMVKRWLELINKGEMPSSFASFIKYLKIKWPLKAYHFWFLLWPRINAAWRIATSYDSLNVFMTSWSKQIEHLEKIEWINTERKKLQDAAIKKAKDEVNDEEKIILSTSTDYHAGIVWIVAWRLSEQHYKPAVVLAIDEEKKEATGSLRAPAYFSIIDMLQDDTICGLLERFGGHQQAWGLTVKLKNLKKLQDAFYAYCQKKISDDDLIRNIIVDTKLSEQDITNNHLREIEKLAPFGIGNKEPLFVLEDVTITKVSKVWRNGNGHVKLHVEHGKHKLQAMFWRKGGDIDSFSEGKAHLIGNIQADDFNGGWQLIGQYCIQND